MKKTFLISDLFADEVVGGAEICNEAIVKYFINNNFDIEKVRSSEVNVRFLELNQHCNFLIANFMLLSEEAKKYFFTKLINKYIIIEHDHKYLSTNNPSNFPNFFAPEEYIINKKFFINAKAVLAQSKLHTQIISKNLLLKNLINLSGNCWTEEQINILKNNINSEKSIEYGILQTNNKNKGTLKAIEYCKNKNLNYELIPLQKYDKFINNLSKVKNLVFFPQWVETFSRVSVEAKILGCKIITNKLIGAASEEFFKKTPNEILEYISNKSQSIPQTILNIFNGEHISYCETIKLPKVSIITSMYCGKKYIKHFLEDICQQTIFSNSELIIIDANSPENEYEIIKPYLDNYSNIKYIKINSRINVQESMNIAIEHATGDYYTIASLDDRHATDALEVQAKNLYFNSDIDLVYFDCFVTNIENNTIENNTNSLLYEHSRLEFKKENMIKCLPGPMPMWKKSMSLNNGKFNEKLKFAGDWDYWLRCVNNGSNFMKINKTLGLYYFNPNGLSTSKENSKDRFLEERELFIKYKHLFGDSIFNIYKGYFDVK